MKALVIGGSSWDTLIHIDSFPKLNGDNSVFANYSFESLGGTGAGKALALDALGVETTLITDLGNDESALKVKDRFSRTNIRLIVVDSLETCTHTNIMYNDGERLSIFTSKLNNSSPLPEGLEGIISEADMVFLNLNGFCRDYIPFLSDFKGDIVVDIHDYDPPNPYHQDFIDIANILFCSDVNITDHIEFMSEMISKGKKKILLTSGSKGAKLMSKNNELLQVKGYTDFKYIDSNGAGDSFCAGFMSKYYETQNDGEALKFANICGGLACTSYDLFNTEYSTKDIENIIKKSE